MNLTLLKLIRLIHAESQAHIRARVKRGMSQMAKRGQVNNMLYQGNHGFEGKIS